MRVFFFYSASLFRLHFIFIAPISLRCQTFGCTTFVHRRQRFISFVLPANDTISAFWCECVVGIVWAERKVKRMAYYPHICAILAANGRHCECTSVVESLLLLLLSLSACRARISRIQNIFKIPLQRCIERNEWQISRCHFTDCRRDTNKRPTIRRRHLILAHQTHFV